MFRAGLQRTLLTFAAACGLAMSACSSQENALHGGAGGHSPNGGATQTGGSQTSGRASAGTGGSSMTPAGAPQTGGAPESGSSGQQNAATGGANSAGTTSNTSGGTNGSDAGNGGVDAGGDAGAGGTSVSAGGSAVSEPMGGAGGSAGTGGITGAAILTVPFSSPEQEVSLTVAFGEPRHTGIPVPSDFSTVREVHFRMCVANASDPSNTFVQASVTDADYKNLSGVKTLLADTAVATCPTMKDIVLPITDQGIDRTRVIALSLKLSTTATAASFGEATEIYLDAVTVTDNIVGPYDFSRNIAPLKMMDSVGSTLRASAPDLGVIDSPGGALIEFPIVGKDDRKISAFSIYLGSPVSFSAPGSSVTYRLCVASAPQASDLHLQHFLTDLRNENLITPVEPLPPISACPTLSELSFVIEDYRSDAPDFDPTRVDLLGFGISSTVATSEASVFFIDSIRVTNDIAGPFDFTLNTNPLRLGISAVNTVLDWVPAPPSAP